MTKRRLLAVSLAVCLLAILACGSLAYFTQSKSVTNYFYITGVTPDGGIDTDGDGEPDYPGDDDGEDNGDNDYDGDDLFSIDLYETEDGEKVDGKTYNDILPGSVLAKDPTIENTGVYSAYVRVNVTVTDALDWMQACEKHDITDLTYIFGGYDKDAWTRYGETPERDIENNTLTYTFYYNEALDADNIATLFTSVTIPAEFDSDDMGTLAAFQIKVTADAVQVANMGDSAYGAFAIVDAEVTE